MRTTGMYYHEIRDALATNDYLIRAVRRYSNCLPAEWADAVGAPRVRVWAFVHFFARTTSADVVCFLQAVLQDMIRDRRGKIGFISRDMFLVNFGIEDFVEDQDWVNHAKFPQFMDDALKGCGGLRERASISTKAWIIAHVSSLLFVNHGLHSASHIFFLGMPRRVTTFCQPWRDH